METLTPVKFDLTKSATFYSRAAKWFEEREMDIRNYQDKTISFTIINEGDKVVWAVSPNGGKTEMAICFIDLYLEDNPTHKVFVSTHNTIILGKNFYDRVLEKKPAFSHQLVTKDNEIDFNKQVIISLPSTLNRRKLPKFDLAIIDEAHQMYESDYTSEEGSMVKRIIKKTGAKRELLLTGTPSYFIRKNQEQKKEIYKMFFVPMSKVYDAEACSDVIVEMAGSSYYITDKDYRGDDIKEGFNFKEAETHKTLDDVNQKIYNRIVSPFRNSRKYSNKELFKPLSTPLDWLNFRKNLGKTLIACRNEPQAKKTAEYYIKNGINVALSTYKDDKDNNEIQRFMEDPDCKILIVVFRGILGFSFNKIENVIDMSLTKNINRMYQLFCRATRKLDGVDKLFIKVIPSDREPHFRIRLTGMLCLMHEEWFSKFNGRNFEELEIPTNKKKSGGSSGGGGTTTNNRPKKEPFPMLGLPSMDILKDLYTKRDELYSPICWSQVGTIMRDLNLEVGKRGVINEEVIEDFYKSYSNKRYKEIYKAGSHIVSKAQKLGIHDLLVKKYNIIYDYNMGEEKYKSLLECVSYKDTIDKGYKSIYGRLMVTKNDELIKEYTGHFIKLRPDSFTFQEGLEYINSLKEYPKKTVSGKDINNGIYRYVFNRNKELFYQYILEKFKDNVPMLFLKDDDKLKRIEKQITECKIYNDWYKKYKSSHEPILTRLNRMDMVEHLNLTKKFKEYNNEAIDEIMKKYVGKRWQDVRKNDYKFLQYLYERPELKDQLFLKYNMVEDPRWTKRKSN